MKIIDIVIKELNERRSQLVTSLLAIVLGIAVIVGIRTITYYSEKAVARELDNLGANIMVLPKSATVSDYYSADFAGEELPESYVDVITSSNLQGVDNLSPKLSIPVEVDERKFVLTGILPRSEFAGKPTWDVSGDIFTTPIGCGAVDVPGLGFDDSNKLAARKEVIKDLEHNQVIVGYDTAKMLVLDARSTMRVMGKDFSVIKVLPQTGTIDDTRIFAHLHTVQELSGKGRVVNAIEIIGCCKEISSGLLDGLNKLLPDARVITITQIANTQMKTNALMGQFSRIFLIIIILVGGVSIANYMFANVQERRREIGTFIAIGMSPGQVMSVFYGKAVILGLAGGFLGYVLGTILALVLGPGIAGVPVLPIPSMLSWALVISLTLSLLATAIPAGKAAKMDPALILMEV